MRRLFEQLTALSTTAFAPIWLKMLGMFFFALPLESVPPPGISCLRSLSVIAQGFTSCGWIEPGLHGPNLACWEQMMIDGRLVFMIIFTHRLQHWLDTNYKMHLEKEGDVCTDIWEIPHPEE